MKEKTLIRLEENHCVQGVSYSLVLQAKEEVQESFSFTIQAPAEGLVHIDLSKYCIEKVQKDAITPANLPSLAQKCLSISFNKHLIRLYHGWVTGFRLGEVIFAGQNILAGLCSRSDRKVLNSLQNKITCVKYNKETDTVTVTYDIIVGHTVTSKTLTDLAVNSSKGVTVIDLSKVPELEETVTLSEETFKNFGPATQFYIKFPKCFRWFPYSWWWGSKIKCLDFSACKHEIGYSNSPVETESNDYTQSEDVVTKPAVRPLKALYAVKSVAALLALATVILNALPLCLLSPAIPGINIAALVCFSLAATFSAISRVVSAVNRPKQPAKIEEEDDQAQQQKAPLVSRVIGGVIITGGALTAAAAITLMALLCSHVLIPSLGVMMAVMACTVAACSLSIGSRFYAACYKRCEGESMLSISKNSSDKRSTSQTVV